MNELDVRKKLRIKAENDISDDIDAIWVYGNQPQSKLIEFSKNISKASLHNTSPMLEAALENAVSNIES